MSAGKHGKRRPKSRDPKSKGSTSDTQVVKAAGGVVWRERGDDIQVMVVHRRRYDDWSLPKGKLDPGEKHKRAALREVLEETGVRCELGPKLTITGYDTPTGPKRVKWWAMQPVDPDDPGTGPADPEEVADAVWLEFSEAWRRVTYGTDRQVLSAFVDRVLDHPR